MNKIELGKIANIRTGKLDANASSEDGRYPFFTCSKEPLSINSYSYDCECVLVAGNGDLNVKYFNGKFDAYQRTYIIEAKDKSELSVKYLYNFIDSKMDFIRSQSIGGVIKYIKLGDLTSLKIPLPPLTTQQTISSELDLLNSLINKQKAQLTELERLAESVFYDMFGDPIENEKGWNKGKLGDVAPAKEYKGIPLSKEGKYWLLNLDMVESNTGEIVKYNFVDKSAIGNSTITFNTDNILYSKLRPYLNKVVVPKYSGFATSELVPLYPQPKLLNRLFLAHFLRSSFFVKYIQEKVAGAKMPRVSMSTFRDFFIILPPISLQNQFATTIEKIEAQKVLVMQSIAQSEQLLASRMQYYFE